jgi:hypothetical protein
MLEPQARLTDADKWMSDESGIGASTVGRPM